jgi:hypothetical protein|tara:strand:- start:10 stop:561 length:552 start_codon:yes stop_codon:yes gene_type:complete
MGSDQFWNSTSIEPKRQHKWLVYLHNSNIPSYVARKVDKPSFSINEQQHKYFGHTFKYPGQVTWDDITMTLVDPIDPNVSDKLQEVLINSGYRTPDNRTNNALYTVSKDSSVKALGPIVRIEQYGTQPGLGAASGEPYLIEAWQVFNPWIKDVKFGELTYEDDGIVTVDLTIAFDWAKLVDVK